MTHISLLLIIVALFVGAYLAETRDGKSAHAVPPITDTVLNVERWVNPNGDRLAAVRPADWRQPAYYIWLTQECAATVHPGNDWPSANPLCQ